MDFNQNFIQRLLTAVRLLKLSVLAITLLMSGFFLWYIIPRKTFARLLKPITTYNLPFTKTPAPPTDSMWQPPAIDQLPATEAGKQIRYGKELIAHTAQYFGPEGSIAHISNGMNCQNCHLEAGTKAFGNNYSLVAATYPRFRGRSGTVENLDKRINDCFERSLNGEPLDILSTEMQAMIAYIEWLGRNVKKSKKPAGAGFIPMALLDRPANPVIGKSLYLTKCQVCHGQSGEGKKLQDMSVEYQFPPLWGKNSYNNGAGLYRLSNLAAFLRANMPLGATYNKPLITEEEAWDIAAFVNSAPRPEKDLSKDWPDISLKPFDHPFGPYADTFSQMQHKLGPFKPIKTFYNKEINK